MINTRATFSTLGASNHVNEEREPDDFYATDPIAIDLLLAEEKFHDTILEPSCGIGHMSKRLIKHDYIVHSCDLVDRGYGTVELDFFNIPEWNGDIITNPPYKNAVKFIKHAINIIPTGHKVAMFLKILFMESKGRKELFQSLPPKTIYISSERILCAKNGDFVNNKTKAVGYAWYVWEKGFTGTTQLKWIN